MDVDCLKTGTNDFTQSQNRNFHNINNLVEVIIQVHFSGK